MSECNLTPAEKNRLAYEGAIRLLARRDHSVAEITRKLQQREHADEAIGHAVQELLDANYLNDKRYAQLYTEQRIERGYGPSAIRSKLFERGIDSNLTQFALNSTDADWALLATQLIHKRFNAEDIVSPDQRTVGRIARFVQGRGFSASDAARALTSARQELQRGCTS